MFLKYDGANASKDRNRDDLDQLLTILELLVVTFVVTLIPYLIDLGRPPKGITELWVPIFSSVLAAMYAYMRVRGISDGERS